MYDIRRLIRSLSLKIKLWTGVLVLSVIAYQVLFSGPVISRVLSSFIPEATDLQFQLRSSSLIFGFVFDNVVLKDRQSGDTIFQADQVRLKWFLPGFLAGQIGIREVGLRNPTVSLIKRNDRWNTDALRSRRPGKPGVRRESTPLPEEIELYLPVRLYGAIRVEGFRFLLQDDSGQRSKKMELADVDFHVGFVTRTFHTIPLNFDALQLFDSLFLAFNPIRPVRFEYTETDRVAGKPLFMVKLYKETMEHGTAFLSRMQIDSRDLSQTGYGIQVPFGIRLDYDIQYDPLAETIIIRQFRMQSGSDTWISLTGNMKKDDEGFHHVDLRMLESSIDLDRLYPLLMRVSSNRIETHGRISLFPLQLTGRLDRLSAHIGLNGAGVMVRTGASLHQLPHIQLDFRGTLDLYSLGLLSRPDSYVADQSLAYGLVHDAYLDRLDLSYNGGTLKGHGTLKPDEGIVLDADVQNFNLGQFTAPDVTGLGSASLHVRSGTDFHRISLRGQVRLNGARYLIDRSLSGVQNLTLDADLDLIFPEKGLRLEVRRADLTGHNSSATRVLHLLAAGNLSFGAEQDYQIQLSALDVDYERLHPLLPGNLRSDLNAVRPYLEKGLHIDGKATIHREKGNNLIQGSISLILPSISVEGFQLFADVSTGNDGFHFRKLHLQGLRGALNADLTGSLVGPAGNRQPNMNFRLNLSRKGMLPVHENVQIDGTVDIATQIRPEQISGSIDIRRLNLIYSTNACNSTAPGCTRYHVDDLNFTLPFVHSMKMTPLRYESLINPDLIDRFPDRPNLTLKSFWSNRSPDGLPVNQGFYFLGAPTGDARPALEANLGYQRNILESRLLRISTYRELKSAEQTLAPIHRSTSGIGFISNGTVEIRNLFFNVADLQLSSMEWGAHLAVHDLNVEPYFPKADSSYDGIISATMNVRGSNLSDAVRSIHARLAVYRISKDFTGLAVRIMVPSDILARLVNNTLEIPSLSVELRGGLVYTTIQVRSSGIISFSRLVKPSDEMIRQERIPLAEFLERTRQETGEFQ